MKFSHIEFFNTLNILSAALDNFDLQMIQNRERAKDFRGDSIVSQVSERIDTIIDNGCGLYACTMY